MPCPGNGHYGVQKVLRALVAELTNAATTWHASLLSGTVRASLVLAALIYDPPRALGTGDFGVSASYEPRTLTSVPVRPASKPVTEIRLCVSLSLAIIAWVPAGRPCGHVLNLPCPTLAAQRGAQEEINGRDSFPRHRH